MWVSLKRYVWGKIQKVVQVELAARGLTGALPAEIARLREQLGQLEAQQREQLGRLETQQSEQLGRLETQLGRLETQQREQLSRLETQQKEQLGQLETTVRDLQKVVAAELAAREAAIEVTQLRGQVKTLSVRAGQLETDVHDLHYWASLYKWRYLSLANETWGKPEKTARPPREIPPQLLDQFTLNGRVPIENIGWDDETRPANWPLIYTDEEIDDYIGRVRARQWYIYGMTDHWLWDAFADFPIAAKGVAIMGSTTPWYESTCIHFGGSPTTIEYNTILVKSKRMRAVTVAEFEKSPEQFDCALSISSFEHDGLGRYGDPIDPDGDLKAMRRMKKIVKPNGLLFLSVPTGRDRILFNSARVYGNVRLPMLIDGWTVKKTYGVGPDTMTAEGAIQPIFVLENQ